MLIDNIRRFLQFLQTNAVDPLAYLVAIKHQLIPVIQFTVIAVKNLHIKFEIFFLIPLD
jgi:hypothetical protein